MSVRTWVSTAESAERAGIGEASRPSRSARMTAKGSVGAGARAESGGQRAPASQASVFQGACGGLWVRLGPASAYFFFWQKTNKY